ncbi:MAG: hypothetical protein ABH803_01935 [Candidatus Micrarchaeota archaeon]
MNYKMFLIGLLLFFSFFGLVSASDDRIITVQILTPSDGITVLYVNNLLRPVGEIGCSDRKIKSVEEGEINPLTGRYALNVTKLYSGKEVPTKLDLIITLPTLAPNTDPTNCSFVNEYWLIQKIDFSYSNEQTVIFDVHNTIELETNASDVLKAYGFNEVSGRETSLVDKDDVQFITSYGGQGFFHEDTCYAKNIRVGVPVDSWYEDYHFRVEYSAGLVRSGTNTISGLNRAVVSTGFDYPFYDSVDYLSLNEIKQVNYSFNEPFKLNTFESLGISTYRTDEIDGKPKMLLSLSVPWAFALPAEVNPSGTIYYRDPNKCFMCGLFIDASKGYSWGSSTNVLFWENTFNGHNYLYPMGVIPNQIEFFKEPFEINSKIQSTYISTRIGSANDCGMNLIYDYDYHGSFDFNTSTRFLQTVLVDGNKNDLSFQTGKFEPPIEIQKVGVVLTLETGQQILYYNGVDYTAPFRFNFDNFVRTISEIESRYPNVIGINIFWRIGDIFKSQAPPCLQSYYAKNNGSWVEVYKMKGLWINGACKFTFSIATAQPEVGPVPSPYKPAPPLSPFTLNTSVALPAIMLVSVLLIVVSLALKIKNKRV